MKYKLLTINEMGQDTFSEVFGGIFEHSPDLARQAWDRRPFTDVSDLYQALLRAQQALSTSDKIALIQAHPDLGSQVKMTEASIQEQTGAGLDRLNAAEFELFTRLNGAYREKFGFPFVMAVRGQTKDTILNAFAERIENTNDSEIERAMAEIAAIAKFRLYDLID
ncbi:MAG: 2-oxo-4-hydroxy-4-carboxy-5-ureidoimidazoline decarboxylase [Synechococcus sp.]